MDFNTPLTSVYRSSRPEKISKETLALNNMLEQMNLTDIYKTFYSKATEYTFFSSSQATFSKIDHMLGQKTSLNKSMRIEIISRIFFWPQRYEIRN